jgi:hypothetical protein
MRALQGLVIVVGMVVVGCKGKGPAPATGSAPPTGSATAQGSADTGSATAPGSAAEAKPVEGDTKAPAAAKVYDGPTFTISSTLPGPDTKQKDIDTDVGKTTMTMYEFADPADDDTMQMVESNPVNAKVTDVSKVLEGSLSGMTGDLKAVIDDKKTVSVSGVSMLDFSSHFQQEGTDYFFRGRVAFKNGNLYQVAAMGKGTKPTASAEQFVGSFRLK